MRDRVLTLPEVAFVAGTRGLLGAGVGLLLADRLTKDQKRVAGWLLAGIGIITTIPAAMALFRRPLVERSAQDRPMEPAPEPSEAIAAAGPSAAAVVPRY